MENPNEQSSLTDQSSPNHWALERDTSDSAFHRWSTPRREITYAAGVRVRGLRLWRDMALLVWHSRDLVWRLFIRDLSARYRQSILSYAWALVPPLVTVATFTYLSRARLFAVGPTHLPYPLFALIGITIWQLFAGGLMAMTQSLVNAGSLITKVNFPREALVLAAFGISLFDFLLRVIVIALVFVAYGIAPAPTALALPLLLVPLSLLSVGMGLVFALLNGVLRDTAQMLSVLLPLWMLLTPVVYPMPQTDPDRTLTRLNPVAPFLATAQDLVCGSRLSDASGLVIACIISLTTFLLGWRLFHVTQPRIAERV